MDYKDAIELCKKKIIKKESAQNLVPFLKSEGFQIITSIKIIRDVLDIELGHAKQIVAGHDVWRDTTKQMDSIHMEIIKEIND